MSIKVFGVLFAAIWGTLVIQRHKARDKGSSESKEPENEWSFGQIASLFMLVVPLKTIFERLYEQRSKISECMECDGRLNDRDRFLNGRKRLHSARMWFKPQEWNCSAFYPEFIFSADAARLHNLDHKGES